MFFIATSAQARVDDAELVKRLFGSVADAMTLLVCATTDTFAVDRGLARLGMADASGCNAALIRRCPKAYKEKADRFSFACVAETLGKNYPMGAERAALDEILIRPGAALALKDLSADNPEDVGFLRRLFGHLEQDLKNSNFPSDLRCSEGQLRATKFLARKNSSDFQSGRLFVECGESKFRMVFDVHSGMQGFTIQSATRESADGSCANTYQRKINSNPAEYCLRQAIYSESCSGIDSWWKRLTAPGAMPGASGITTQELNAWDSRVFVNFPVCGDLDSARVAMKELICTCNCTTGNQQGNENYWLGCYNDIQKRAVRTNMYLTDQIKYPIYGFPLEPLKRVSQGSATNQVGLRCYQSVSSQSCPPCGCSQRAPNRPVGSSSEVPSTR